MSIVITEDNVKLETKLRKSANVNESICILAHGITVDMTEGGIFDRLSNRIIESGSDTIQFDFRGHGSSAGTSKGMTISGEIQDLIAIIDHCIQLGYKTINLISASFGAVSSSCLPLFHKNQINKLVLWNPVLDLLKTFTSPLLPWGKASFDKESLEKLNRTGSLFIDGEFEISGVLVNEFQIYKPNEKIMEYNSEILILHGDKDTYVPFDVAFECSIKLANSKFITVNDSEHGFGREIDERIAIAETVAFLSYAGL